MTRWVVAFGFFVAFAAGYVVGLRPRHWTASPATRPSRHGGWLAAELKLTPEQQQQLDEIWSTTARRGRHGRDESRRELIQQRDEAIAELIPPENQAKYQQIMDEFSSNMEQLDREWKSRFQEAVERTKEILNPEQRAKYERLLERHQAERARHDRRPEDHRSNRERPEPPNDASG